MPPARKCRRTCAPPVPELPVWLLLDIAARTDAPTILRCTATCKLLRREILSADFVRRVCQLGPDAVEPTLCVLADTFSVVHPVTVATKTLEWQLAQAAAGLLDRYEPLKSRNGLVVLCQRPLGSERRRSADLCVYDPVANSSAFLPFAPDIGRSLLGGVHLMDQCALLTAADGVGCSFMLVAADMARNPDCASSARVRVQTVSSSDCGWGPVMTSDLHPCPRWCTNRDTHNDAAVVAGGVVHWLLHCGISSSPSLQEGVAGEYILTYDVNAATVGSVDVPMDRPRPDLQIEPAMPSGLASSPDGKLSFVVVEHWKVSVWVLSGRDSWARHVQIYTRALREGPMLWAPWTTDHGLELMESFIVDRRGAVLLRFGGARFVLDMEPGPGATCPTRVGGQTTRIRYVVHLASRLASMKSF